MVRSLVNIANKVKKERLIGEVGEVGASISKFSSDSDESSQSVESDDEGKGKEHESEDDDDEDDDESEEEPELKPVPKRAAKSTPSRVEKLKAAVAPSSSSKKKSKALERVKAMDLAASPKGSPKSRRKSSTPQKLKPVPANYLRADYQSPKPSTSRTPKSSGKTPRKSVPVIAQQRRDNVRISVIKTNADGTQDTYVFGSVPKTTPISQLVFNLPTSWTTRRSDVYSVKGDVIDDLDKTLVDVGLGDGGEIDSVGRATSG